MARVGNVRDLLDALSELQELYAATGAKSAEKAIAKVTDLLTPQDGKSLDMLIEEVRTAAASAEHKSAHQPAAIDEAVVERYAQRLADAGTQQGVFQEAFVALTEDSRVKLKEADAIARHFTQRHSPFRTKKAALAAIKQTFVDRARFENKLRAVS